jgi:hypothetical protein
MSLSPIDELSETENEDIIPFKKAVKPIFQINTNNEKIISILSYTLSYNCSYFVEKINKVINLIKLYKPDIIALHLIEPETFNEINSKINSIYSNIQVFKNEKLQIGSALFLKRENITFEIKDGNPYYFDLENSTSNKKIIGVEVQLYNKKFHIITTHLEEKEENDTIRSEQFDILYNVIKNNNIKNCIILGNFESYSINEDIENKLLLTELKDAWINAGCPENVRNTYFDMRHERIYILKLNKLKLVSLGLFGNQNISKIIKQSPSDHFGLIAKYKLFCK